MGFNPSNFPPIADAERLRTEAEKFKTGAGTVADLSSDSYNSWAGMPNVYEAPEASIVYGAFGPVKTSGQDLADDAATVKSAIETYASEAESIKSRYDALMVRWESVQEQKAADDEWQEDEELVKEDNDIISDSNAIMADYMAAQRACANKITSIYGGPTYVPTTQEGAGADEVQYGFTGEQLDAAAAEGKLPWGELSEYDAPWWEDGWNIVASFGKGVWSGVTGTATGLWNMVNVGDMETFKATWKGIATLAMDVAVVSAPGIQTSSRAMEARQRLLAVGKSAIHWDEWQEDPAYAAGASTFDLATILLTAGAGAVTKTGSVASKVSTVAGAGTKAGTAVKVTGLGAVARTTVKVTDLATDLKIKSLDLSTTVAQNSLGKLAPVASRLDEGLNSMRGPEPSFAGVGSNGSRPFSDAVEAGITRMDADANGGGSGTSAGDTAGPGGSSPHGGDTRAPAPTLDGSGADAPAGGNSITDTPDGGNSPTSAPAAGASDGGGSGASDGGGSSEAAPTTGPSDGAGADPATSEGANADPDAQSNAPATDAGDGTDAETGAPAAGTKDQAGVGSDTPASGDDAGDNGSSDGDGGTDAPKATVIDRNEDGTPKTVKLPNGHEHTVSMSSDQLAESTTARQEAVLSNAREHGLDQKQFEDLIHKRGDELTPEQAEKLVDIRHSIELSNGSNTVFQKVLNPGFVDDTLNNDSLDKYRQRMGGFISDGADTAYLRTPEDIIRGLRLDYTMEDGTPGPFTADSPVHAVRFQTSDTGNVGIPDELLRQQLPDGHPAADLPDTMNKVPAPPHTSTGYTGSTVEGQRTIPEYTTRGEHGVRMRTGAEMWRINKAGQEVLVGIFDGEDWVRIG